VVWPLANTIEATLVRVLILEMVPLSHKYFPVFRMVTLSCTLSTPTEGLVVVPAPIVAWFWRETMRSSISAFCFFLKIWSSWIVSHKFLSIQKENLRVCFESISNQFQFE